MRPNALIGVVAAGFLLTLGMTLLAADGRPGERSSDEDESRIQAGLRYAQVQGITLNFKKHNRALVGLGSYLVNAVGGCNDCHTAPPFTLDPYAGVGAPKHVNVACYLAGGTAFGPPPFGLPPKSPVSRDITPWENRLPAGLSRNGFVRVMRTGEDPDNPGHVLRVMPWPVYQSMTDDDLRAIYEYLSAIPAITPGTCGVPSVS